jgi:pullulanase/glycogen debranching enzyme
MRHQSEPGDGTTMSDDTTTKSIRQRVKEGPPPSGNTDLRNRDLSRTEMQEWSELGEFVVDDPLLVLFNAYWEPLGFTLPWLEPRRLWRLIIDTARPSLAAITPTPSIG